MIGDSTDGLRPVKRDARRGQAPSSTTEKSNGKVGPSVGFCLGGGLSIWAAASDPDIGAAVTYYYVMPHGKPDFRRARTPVLGHFGTRR